MGVLKKIAEKAALEAAEAAGKSIAKKTVRAKELEMKAAEAYAQMPEYLQDPYLGLSTSNIGNVTKAILAKSPRMSKAELEAAGYYHPVGAGVKLKKPISEMTFETIDDPRFNPVPVKLITPEALYGKVGVPLIGDRAEAGKILKSVEGEAVDVPLEGGRYFMRSHTYPKNPEKSAAWSSDKTVSNKLSKAIKRGAEESDEVYGINVAGSPTNVDFNTMLSSTLMQRFDPSKVKLKDILDFNREVKDVHPEFFGIDHPDVLDQLNKPGAGNLRKHFADRIATAKYQNAGFPDFASSVKAVTDPGLLDVPTGSSGLAIAKMDPTGRIIEEPLHEHGTYKAPLAGEYAGELQVPLDFRDIFQTATDQRRLLSLPVQSDLRSLSFQSPAVQKFDQEWLDRVMPVYEKKIKELTGKKKGGEVSLEDQMKLDDIVEDQHFGFGGAVAKKVGKKAAEEIAEDVAKRIKMPPPENAARTQIVGTKPTYDKAREILKAEGIDKDIIDFGAGKGLGSYGWADSYEPFPQGWHPTYTSAEDIPSDKYKGLLNLNVLNVVDPETRAAIVEDLGRVIQPEGGIGLITTRGRDVLNTIGGVPGPEPMSVITSRETYQKGFTPEELRVYMKYILGEKFDYEPLNLGPAGVKIKKKAEGGSIHDDVLKEEPRGKISGAIADVLKPASDFLSQYEVKDYVPLIGGTDIADLTGVKGAQTLAEDISKGYSPVHGGSLQTATFDPRLVDAAGLVPGVGQLMKLGKNLGKTAIEQAGKNIVEGRMPGIINPRMNIIKDPGGMLVGGEKDLDNELLYMKKNEGVVGRYIPSENIIATGPEGSLADKNAVALNNWIDTKVRKYLRNQAGSEADPILKAIESGVEHNFQPAMGDTKYSVKNKRFAIGKPEEGIAKTNLGKEWEYKVDSMFDPHSTAEIKEILNHPMEFADPGTSERRKASLLRVEHNLPIENEKDVEALRLINHIPDENVYTLSGTNITERLGLNHVSDVLMEDLRSGKLRPEQLDQMSIEKAIRHTAEYDAQKAREMTKAHATSVEGMPIPKEYDDGFKWVELKHDTDPKKTAAALKSEGAMMGHCVGSYCPQVESGGTQIFSLRGPDNKSHVTIEVSKKSHLGSWLKANEEEINKDPLIKQMHYPSPDERYHQMYTEEELDEIYKNDIAKMLKMKGVTVKEPEDAWLDIVQVKGKQNKRPDDKYQKYVTDFVKSNVAKHEITDIRELQNTDLHDIQEMIATGLTSKSTHMHPDVDKAVAKMNPHLADKFAKHGWSEEIGDAKYELLKNIGRDFASKGQYYVTDEDILNAVREKHLKAPGKKRGGPITKRDLEIQMKLDDIIEPPQLRRHYG